MKKVLKWVMWTVLSVFFLVLTIVVPIGVSRVYENLRASSLSDNEKYTEDLARLEYLLKNEFAGYEVLPGRESFDSILNQLKVDAKQGRIASQTDFNLSVIKAVSSFKDPHTSVYSPSAFLDLRFPYYLNWSNGGFYLLSGTVEKKWLGAEVTKIGKVSSEEVYKKLSAYTNAPNEAGTAFFMRPFLYSADVLYKEGIIENPDQIDLEISLKGEEVTLSFNSMTRASFASLSDYYRISEKYDKDELPLYLTIGNQNYWYEHLQETNTLYLRYNLCVAQGDIELFWDEVFDELHEVKPSKFIIDVRGNPGGDTQNHSSFINRLSQDTVINQYGRLFTLIDGGTGSAAVSFASDMEKMTQTLLVGEKTMDKPNTTSDPTFFTLPHAKVTLLIPSLYSLHTYEGDSREAIYPDILISQKLGGDSYLRDEVMDSVLNFQSKNGPENYAALASKIAGQYDFSPIRNASLSLRDSVWYFAIEGLFDAPVYQNDTAVFTRKYDITFTHLDSLGEYISIAIHGKELQLHKIDDNRISLEQSIVERNFEEAEKILSEIKKGGRLPYFLDRPYFQQRVYRIYNESGFDEAMALNQVTKKMYPYDPVVSIVDYELYQYEDRKLGQVKSIFPILWKLMYRYVSVITTDKVMNDDYNAFIGR